MALITATQVFEFMGSEDKIVDDQTTNIDNLIEKKTDQLTTMIGRELTLQTFTDTSLQNGFNARIIKNTVFLLGELRDIKTITAITEDGEAITEITSFNDGNDFYLDTVRGTLTKPDIHSFIITSNLWSLDTFAIKISGTLGLGTSITETSKELEQILIEMVAVDSNYWRINSTAPDGSFLSTVRTILSDETIARINAYRTIRLI